MNLQLALIAIGIVVVAGIYFYSRWEAPRNRHKRHKSALNSPTEPSFNRGEPSFSGEMDADYQGIVDEDSAFSSYSNLDAYTDAEEPDDEEPGAEEPGAEEPDDEGVVEEKYSRSVDLSISDQPEASTFKPVSSETLEGDILTTDIPVLEARVDQNEGGSLQQQYIDDSGKPSSQDAPESEPEQELEAELEAELVKETLETEIESEFDASEMTGGEESVAEDTPLEQAPDEIAQSESSDIEADLMKKYSKADQKIDLEQSQPEDDYANQLVSESNDDEVESDFEQTPHDDEDLHDEEDMDRDALPEKSSRSGFFGSLKQFHRIKDSIQHKLEAVRADREKSLREQDDDASESREEEHVPVQSDLLDDDKLAPESVEKVEEKSSNEKPSRSEPRLGNDVDAGSEGEQETGQNAQNTVAASSQTDTSISAAEGFEKLSQIDYYVKLSGERDVSRESVLAIYREAATGLSKNHSIYGLRMPDKVWRDLENEPEESRFGDLVITIQLADQNGPVTEHDMTRFSALVMKLSESTGRGFAFMAPIESAHEQAQAIEKFRKRFDSIFVVNIRPLEEETFDGAVIERCASQIGLAPDSNNFYARYKPVGKQKVCLYSLANMSDTGEFDMDNLRALKTRGVTFFTRPAVNRSPGAVFAEMVDAAKAFASRIKGEVIAPGYDDLSMEDAEAIRKSIEKVATEMEGYGIIPGSDEATRLF
ncbi:MAG: cell division protein ZipA C-terminal FtsZ-binding domain-containing protein [Arenicellales bacterium]